MSVDIELAKKMVACLPFADEKAGITETQQVMREMIDELTRLRQRVVELEKELAVERKERDGLWWVIPKDCKITTREGPWANIAVSVGKMMDQITRLTTERDEARKDAEITNEAMHSLAEIISDLGYRKSLGTTTDGHPDFACLHCMADECQPHKSNCPIGDAVTSKNEVMDAVKRDRLALTRHSEQKQS